MLKGFLRGLRGVGYAPDWKGEPAGRVAERNVVEWSNGGEGRNPGKPFAVGICAQRKIKKSLKGHAVIFIM